MENEIARLISRYMELSEDEERILYENIPIKAFKKGDLLLREGQISALSYFNIEGLVRKYFIVDGEERTVEFFAEGESIASLDSYLSKTPADHFLECVEDCRLAVMSPDQEAEIFKQMPRFESLCRVSVEGDFGKKQNALAKFMTSSPEERYLQLLKERPDLIQRVQQYHLASYLGIKPESLSRIRKRLANKEKNT